MNVVFPTIDDVLELHALSLRRYGGTEGIRERALLESALAQPQAIFGGRFLYEDLFTMAAAYVFHLVKNHPFIDGNKRIGLATALAFLDINGVSIDRGTDELFSDSSWRVTKTAMSSVDKLEVFGWEFMGLIEFSKNSGRTNPELMARRWTQGHRISHAPVSGFGAPNAGSIAIARKFEQR
jgi:death on curing protein